MKGKNAYFAMYTMFGTRKHIRNTINLSHLCYFKEYCTARFLHWKLIKLNIIIARIINIMYVLCYSGRFLKFNTC